MDNSSTPLVLIVDDNSKNLQILGNLLKDKGHKVAVAQNGDQALNYIKTQHPDLILLDVMMPGMNGFEVCRRIKKNKQTSDIPVLFITALTDTEHKLKGFAAGGEDYITKPFFKEEVLARVNVFIERQKTEKALKKSHVQLEDLNKTLEEKVRTRTLKLQQMQAQIIMQEKMAAIGTLAGGIAHDFNNILASVIGFSELTMMETNKNSSAYKNMNQVLSAGLRAKELVQQILTFSRRDEKEPKPVLVKPLIIEVLKLIRASLPSSIKIEQNLTGNPLILAGSTQIHQVLMNLCTNAGHALDEKGGILLVELASIEVSKGDPTSEKIKCGPYVRLIVSDTGCGMETEVKQRIFDPFFTTKKRGHGTGMGLSVVHGIISDFGGSILVHSKPNKGSSFQLFFPAIERRFEPEKRPVESLLSGDEHILFIDDEAPILNMSRQILESMGYRVSTCISSLEALNVFQNQKEIIDLVIADIDMPDLTGFNLTKKLFELKPEIPVVLCSGYSSKFHEQYAIEIGVRAYLTKPILMRELLKTIRTILDTPG